jgi:hypothetical protein
LSLCNVKRLTDGAAARLGRHKGFLCLSGLEEISSEGAKALLKHNTKDGSLSGCMEFLNKRAGISENIGFFKKLFS